MSNGIQSYNDSILGDLSGDDERELDIDAESEENENKPKGRGRGRGERSESRRNSRKFQEMWEGWDTND